MLTPSQIVLTPSRLGSSPLRRMDTKSIGSNQKFIRRKRNNPAFECDRQPDGRFTGALQKRPVLKVGTPSLVLLPQLLINVLPNVFRALSSGSIPVTQSVVWLLAHAACMIMKRPTLQRSNRIRASTTAAVRPIKSRWVHGPAGWGPEQVYLPNICCPNPSGCRKVQ